MNTSDVQILLADLQPQLIVGSTTCTPRALSRGAEALARTATILGLPLTFSIVAVAGKPGELIPELLPFATPQNTFARAPASPFLDAPTVAALARHGRNVLVIAGFSCEVVVLHAALGARVAGYEVQVPVDAVGGRSQRTEDAVFRQIEAAGGVCTSIASLMTLLEPDLTRPPGSQVLETLQALHAA